MVNDVCKPKPIKGMTIKYDGEEYTNILYLSRGYDYSSFSYLDDNGTEFSVSLGQGKSFEIVQDD